MRRRDFLAVVGGVVATWPLAAFAQQPLPLVGYISSRLSAAASATALAALRDGLAQTGFVEGRTVAIEYHFMGGRLDQLPTVVSQLVRSPVSVIFAQSTVAALAAKKATSTTPIVFFTGEDPVAIGLVSSFNRPGGNVTGVAFVNSALAAKRLQLLRSLAPKAEMMGMLADTSTEAQNQVRDAESGARALGQALVVLNVSTDSEVDSAFANFAQRRVGALLIAGGPLMASRAGRVSTLAARYTLPTIYPFREFAPNGLMSYGPSFNDTIRQGGVYIGRILRGENPTDLPVAQPTKFELVINLGTAKALGIDLPPILLALADEVIE